jgi:hypothetical protein
MAGCTLSSDEYDAALGDEEAIGEAAEALSTLQFVDEEKISSLLSGSSKYEASGVQLRSGTLYVVFDDSARIGQINTALTSGTLSSGSTSKSEYEGITYDDVGTPHFYVMKEMENKKGKVFQYDTSLNLQSQEWTDVTFQVTNKGFEGVAYVRKGTDDYLLGLCEGNNCLDVNQPVGNGKLKVLRQSSGSWVTETTLNIPSSANFVDYSDIALRSNGDGTFKVAITSQESSKLWVGTLTTSPWGFSGTSAVYTFPKTALGETQYCNVEGVTFLSASRIAVVSDQYTSDTNPDSPCFDKDESVHIFDIPAN